LSGSPSHQNKVRLPHNYTPRGYQLKAWGALEHGIKRAVIVWHRRAGKDLMLLNRTICATQERVGVYWHVFPAAKQGRKIIWDGVTKDGRPFLDYWPSAMIAERNATEMRLKLTNGSVWQVVGSDNYNDALIGGNPVGLVMSEYALQNPSCWNYLRPILAENEGWAAFPFTPRGKNHGHALFEMAKANPKWFCERLSADDTKAISAEAIEEERAAGMPEELIEQEFFCSFEAALVGAYYGKLMKKAQEEGRIGRVPYEPQLPVETWWDLGVDDQMSIWFAQRYGREIRLIDYYENNGYGLDHYAKVLRDKDYSYSRYVLPHDIRVREMGSAAKTRLQTLKRLMGELDPDDEPTQRYVVVPKQPPVERINATRLILPRCYFDEKCGRGIEALKQYQRLWDDDKKTFKEEPFHDWTSHGSDAFGHGAIVLKDAAPVPLRKKPLETANSGLSSDW
jgi:phage terminase large subunit